jgi:ApbE superfamily uncharacterized protein (UPF0280 family)
MESNRFYRNNFKAAGLKFFNVCIGQTDMYIGAEKVLEKEARDIINYHRAELTAYIKKDINFLHSLVPVKPLKNAPMIVLDMCAAAEMANVGPMAAVAGAFSKFTGQELLKYTDQIIVENGGDIFIKSNIERKIAVYAGNSPLSNKLFIKLKKEMTPCGICTSSGTVGHSLSFGKADAAMVIHPDASVADCFATALGNMVKSKKDIEPALNSISKIPDVKGALVIIGNALGAIGEIELCE